MLALLVMLTITGCSWMPFFGDDEKDKEPETAGYTETDFYEVIQRNLNARNWKVAIENLQALEAQFPFGTYAEQSQLELMYAYYRSADYEAAIAAADRFIRLHPRHANVDYA
jgi:outer membrane protein assembly factor BamD